MYRAEPPVEQVPAGLRVALRQRGLRPYLIGQGISIAGTWMQVVALAWLAFDLTGSAFAVGLVTTARTLPILILALPFGVVGDRMDRRRLIVVAALLGAVVAAIIAVLDASGRLDLLALLILSAVAGAVHALEVPTYNAYLGQLAGPHVVHAIALNGAVFNIARIVGPAAAAWLLATGGAAFAFGANAVSYLLLAAILLFSRPARWEPHRAPSGGIREALAFVRGDPRLSIVLGLLAAHTMTMSIPLFLAAPIASDLTGGSDTAVGTGLLVAAIGAGSLVGLAAIARSRRRPDLRWLVVAGVVGSVGQAALGMVMGLEAGLAAAAVAGAGIVAYTATSNAILQLLVPDRMRARVMSFYGIVLPGIAPASAFVAGALGAAIGTDATLLVAACAWLAILGVAAFATRHAGVTLSASTSPN